MFSLTREVRWSMGWEPADLSHGVSQNSFAGAPAMLAPGQFFNLQVTVSGPLQADSNYLLNIRDIDDAVRSRIVPSMSASLRSAVPSFDDALRNAHKSLAESFAHVSVDRTRLGLTPFLSLAISSLEFPMVRLSQRFEFSASHRLHNPALSDADNIRLFGKCNNPHGHGHNYELEVTISGSDPALETLPTLPRLEQVVLENIIRRFDHKNLNVELTEFRTLNPTVENIAQVIYRALKPQLASADLRLASVTVWETPKTWCAYSESSEA